MTSGDAAVRRECTSRRETFPNFKYRDDTFSECVANNLLSQPEPPDVYGYHLYATGTPRKRWRRQPNRFALLQYRVFRAWASFR